MNLTHAALLIATAFGVTELAKSLIPNLSSRLVVLLTLVVGIGAVFLVGATVWAHQQVVGGHALDQLSVADKFLVGLFVGGGASFTNRVLGAVSNIGENQKP